MQDAMGHAAAQLQSIRLPDDTVRAIRELQQWVKVNGPKFAEIAVIAQSNYRRSMADNLRDLTAAEWIAAMKLMHEPDGQVIVWTPPATVVQELLAAQDAKERELVLVRAGPDISRHAREVLGRVTVPRLQDIRAAANEGWDAWDAGLARAAQALAAACLTSIIQDVLAFDGFAELRIRWENEQAASLSDASHQAAVRLTHEPNCDRHPARGQCSPRVNRHASAHHVDPAQYTPSHSLQALMLVTAWAANSSSSTPANTSSECGLADRSNAKTLGLILGESRCDERPASRSGDRVLPREW